MPSFLPSIILYSPSSLPVSVLRILTSTYDKIFLLAFNNFSNKQIGTFLKSTHFVEAFLGLDSEFLNTM